MYNIVIQCFYRLYSIDSYYKILAIFYMLYNMSLYIIYFKYNSLYLLTVLLEVTKKCHLEISVKQCMTNACQDFCLIWHLTVEACDIRVSLSTWPGSLCKPIPCPSFRYTVHHPAQLLAQEVFYTWRYQHLIFCIMTPQLSAYLK